MMFVSCMKRGQRTSAPASLSKADITRQVRDFLAARYPALREAIAQLGDDQRIWDVVDSLSLLDLVEYVEHAFSIRIAPIDFIPENFETLHRLADFVARCRRL